MHYCSGAGRGARPWLLAAACLLTLVGCAASSSPESSGDGRSADARVLLDGLTAAPEDRETPYERASFGYADDEHPVDPDGDGCWARREVLIRDNLDPGLRVEGDSCFLDGGRWRSVYDDRTWTDPDDLQVDHLVPLAEAWRSGAADWSDDRLVAFGNDIGYEWDLQAVTAALNEDKEDRDPAEWLPPANRCTYAKAWIGVKARWRLTVDDAERSALERELEGCDSLAVLRPGRPDLAALL